MTGQRRQQGDRNAGVLHERLGQRGTTGLLRHQHEVDVGQAHAADGFGRQHARQAELHQARPAFGVVATHRGSFARLRRAGRHPQLGRRAHVVEQFADGRSHHPLLFAEREIHGPYLGMPSTRSAMMLRWISLVPA